MRNAVIPLALAIGVCTAQEASAGNLDTFVLGNDAAMMGGAVSATATGSTAIWYDPAGLDGATFQSVDVGFNAYAVRFGSSPDLTADASKGGHREKLTNLDISPVPTTLAYTRRIGGWQVGAGLFVPNRSLYLRRTLVRVTDGNRVTSLVLDGNSSPSFSPFAARTTRRKSRSSSAPRSRSRTPSARGRSETRSSRRSPAALEPRCVSMR